MANQKKKKSGNYIAVKRIGLCTFTDEGLGSIPGQETKISKLGRITKKKKKKKTKKKKNKIIKH